MEKAQFVLQKSKGKLAVKKVRNLYNFSQFVFSDSDLDKLVNAKTALDPEKLLRNRCILRLMAECGLRRAEVRDLKVENIQWTKASEVVGLLFVLGKGAKIRPVPVHKTLLDDIKIIIRNRSKGFVFLSRFGKPLSLQMVNEIVKKAGVVAGVTNPNVYRKHINPHQLRHHYMRMLKRGSMDIADRQAIAGHSDSRTTANVYSSPDLEELKQLYLDKFYKRKGEQK
jgi:integrase